MLNINFKWLKKSRRSSEPQPAESEAEIADRDAMRMYVVQLYLPHELVKMNL